MCIDFEGTLWAFGKNESGQLGTGNKKTYATPQKIQNIPPVRSVACGRKHTLIITEELDLWSAGSNDNAQLCLGNIGKVDKLNFTKSSFSDIAKIIAGSSRSIFQDSNGIIYGCGTNSWQILDTDWDPKPIPNQPENIIQICCVAYRTLLLDINGNVFSITHPDGSDSTNTKLETSKETNMPPNIKYIYCSAGSIFLIDGNENLWSYGINCDGILGHGKDESILSISEPTLITSIKNMQQVAEGWSCTHVLVQDYENKIFGIGRNNYGQLGINILQTSIPVELDHEYHSIWGDRKITSYVPSKSARK